MHKKHKRKKHWLKRRKKARTLCFVLLLSTERWKITLHSCVFQKKQLSHSNPSPVACWLLDRVNESDEELSSITNFPQHYDTVMRKAAKSSKIFRRYFVCCLTLPLVDDINIPRKTLFATFVVSGPSNVWTIRDDFQKRQWNFLQKIWLTLTKSWKTQTGANLKFSSFKICSLLFEIYNEKENMW